MAVQNSRGNGLDVVYRTRSGELAFGEVKTSSRGSFRLSPRQQDSDFFIRDVLTNAAQQSGRYTTLNDQTSNLAQGFLDEYTANPDIALKYHFTVDTIARAMTVYEWGNYPNNPVPR